MRCATTGCRGFRPVGHEMCHTCWRKLTGAERSAIMSAKQDGRLSTVAALGALARERIGTAHG